LARKIGEKQTNFSKNTEREVKHRVNSLTFNIEFYQYDIYKEPHNFYFVSNVMVVNNYRKMQSSFGEKRASWANFSHRQ